MTNQKTGIEVISNYQLDENDRVTPITFTAGDQICTGTVNVDNPDQYDYTSQLIDDSFSIKAPDTMSLANVILNAYVHLGVIPPTYFDPISCENQH